MTKCLSRFRSFQLSTWGLFVIFLASGFVVTAQAKLVSTGVTLYGATDSRGTFNGYYDYWDTRGENPGYNVYLFTGSTKSPNFLNMGDSDETLDPEVELKPGTNTIHFAVDIQDTDPATPYLGLNLYFNEDLITNRISAVVRNGGSCDFSVVKETISTYGQYGQTPGSGTLSYAVGDLTATLSGFCTSSATPKLVSATDNTTGPDQNIVGSFTLTITKTGPNRIVVNEKKRLSDFPLFDRQDAPSTCYALNSSDPPSINSRRAPPSNCSTKPVE